MSDLRDYQVPFFELHKSFSKQRTSTNYQQLWANGSDNVELHLKNGQIESYQIKTDLAFHRMAAQKSSAWKVATDTTTEFGDLQSWPQLAERMLSSAVQKSDPRPPFASNPKVEELTSGLSHYDPNIAQPIAALVFHRAFQTLSNALKKGLLVNAHMTWTHGGRFWNHTPRPFAWNDANGFYFNPQTCIHESIELYHPNHPHLKRVCQKTTYRLNDFCDLTKTIEALLQAQSAPLLAWSKRNIDRVIVLPSAMAPIVAHILDKILQNPNNFHSIAAIMGPHSVLLEAPADPIYSRNGIIDAHGSAVQPLVLVQNERPRDKVTQQNGHWADPSGTLNLFAPIFCAGSEQPELDDSPEAISSSRPGRIAFIEHSAVFNDQVFFPYGGVLYHDGRLLGHVAPPSEATPIQTFLKNTRPLGQPIRCAELATCAIEFIP